MRDGENARGVQCMVVDTAVITMPNLNLCRQY